MSMVIDSSNIFSLTGSTEAASKAYNLARTDFISYQLNYSGTSQSAAVMASSTNVTHAVQTTSTVTVSSYANLIGTAATASTTITFGTPANGDTIIFTGLPGGSPVTFTKVTTPVLPTDFSTAANLATAIDAVLTDVTASNTTGTITLTVVTKGTAMNAATVTGTGSFSTLSITFSGGINNGVLTINGTQYVQGVDWTAATDNATTATSIAALTPTGITGAAVSAVVTFTNTAYGTVGNTNTITTSDATNLPITAWTGGVDALFTKTAHGLITGVAGIFSTSSAAPSGITVTSVTYYVIALSANTFAVATSLANANAGTRVQFTSNGTGNQTFTPTTISQVVKLQQSNDGITYFDVSGVTVTISSATAASTLWLVTNPPCLWHRISVVPTSGALNLAVVVCNRNNSITGSAS